MREQKEAMKQTHQEWMGNLLGIKNCHFLEAVYDQTRPCCISIDPTKTFNKEVQFS